MSSLNIGYNPAVTFALWRLQHGETPDEVMASMMASRQLEGISQTVLRLALQAAEVDYAATLSAQAQANAPLCEGLADCSPSDTLTVRVLVKMYISNGATQWANVVIDAQAGLTPDALLALVKAWIMSGGWSPQGRGKYNLRDVDVFLQQVLTGSSGNAARSFP